MSGPGKILADVLADGVDRVLRGASVVAGPLRDMALASMRPELEDLGIPDVNPFTPAGGLELYKARNRKAAAERAAEWSRLHGYMDDRETELQEWSRVLAGRGVAGGTGAPYRPVDDDRPYEPAIPPAENDPRRRHTPLGRPATEPEDLTIPAHPEAPGAGVGG